MACRARSSHCQRDAARSAAQDRARVGRIRWNGQAIPFEWVDDWVLVFVDRQKTLEYKVELPGGADEYSLRMYPGTYDIYFDLQRSVIPDAPDGRWLVESGAVIAHDARLDVQPTAVALSGDIDRTGSPSRPSARG